MSDHFITEFGHRIDFLPGYLERNRYYVDDAKRHAAYWAGEVSTYGQAGNGDVQIYAVAKDLVQFSACLAACLSVPRITVGIPFTPTV